MDGGAGRADRRHDYAEAGRYRVSNSSCPATSRPGTRRRSTRVSAAISRIGHVDFGTHVQKGPVAGGHRCTRSRCPACRRQGQARIRPRRKSRSGKRNATFADTTYARWRDSPKGVVSVQETGVEEGRVRQLRSRATTRPLADANVDQSQVDQLTAFEDFKRIVAPFDGIVTARNTDVGALINAGSGVGGGNGPQLFRVADVHEMRVFVQVPQEMSAAVHAGLTADLTLPQYPGQDVQGGGGDHLRGRSTRPREPCSSSSMPTMSTTCCSRGRLPKCISTWRAIPVPSAFRQAH